MKIRTRWIFTIILCLLIAIPLAACDGSPATPNGTLESKNGVTVKGTFADGAALEAVEVVGADKIDGDPHKRWSMWLNSMQREEPYLGLTCNEQHVKACDSSEALHRCCMAVVSSCREMFG